MKNLVLVLVLGLITPNLFSQRINYRDVKNMYSTKNYSDSVSYERYNPFIAGVSQYFFPGLGHLYAGEPLRGACFFAAETTTVLMTGYSLLMAIMEPIPYNTGEPYNFPRYMFFGSLSATAILHLWGTFDAVKVAKIKNLAYQDQQIHVNVMPTIDLLKIPGASQTSAFGLGLRISF